MAPREEPSAQPIGTTFLVSVRSRQNATWQGMIQWLEGKKTKSFRSQLEMIQLIQEAWEEDRGSEPGQVFANWEERDQVS
ncbi:hypothetical protein ASZ90_018518 [hydrocarbon metagenome]|uniref:Uncharacterized protein n=1 Tax=hydrocarbon metagenome TaxID=938273 RepID=A0A0W8E5Z9_9ZZZZ